jgi:hypothetical protein
MRESAGLPQIQRPKERGPGISHRASQIDSLGGSGWIEERIERSIDQIEKWLHLQIFDFELLY